MFFLGFIRIVIIHANTSCVISLLVRNPTYKTEVRIINYEITHLEGCVIWIEKNDD